MRIDEIVNTPDTPNTPSLQEIAVSIKRDCSPFLSQIKGRVDKLALFRGVGVRTSATTFSRNAIRSDRSPLSTHPFVHDISDQWFLNRFGIKYRSNALFTSGDPKEAGGYGLLYAIFPIGEFDICYSPVIKDLFNKWDDCDRHDHSLSELSLEIASEEIDNILRAGNYKTGPLTTAIKSGNEVMVHCSEYYQLKVAGNYKTILANLQKELSLL